MFKINKFDKEKLSNLIQKAIGVERSLNQYSSKCGISSAHISRLSRSILEHPPTPQILQKMADASQGRVTYSEFMQACGYIDDSINDVLNEAMIGMSKEEYNNLTEIQKKQIRDFAIFVKNQQQ